jgi:hypothetical protein
MVPSSSRRGERRDNRGRIAQSPLRRPRLITCAATVVVRVLSPCSSWTRRSDQPRRRSGPRPGKESGPNRVLGGRDRPAGRDPSQFQVDATRGTTARRLATSLPPPTTVERLQTALHTKGVPHRPGPPGRLDGAGLHAGGPEQGGRGHAPHRLRAAGRTAPDRRHESSALRTCSIVARTRAGDGPRSVPTSPH